MSPVRIRKELNAVQVSILRRKGTRERYAMPSPVTTDAKRFLTCVGLTWNEAPCNATVLVKLRDIEAPKEDDGFEGAFLSS